ncbi:MAG: hypothetical protein B1H04_04290 [Planctomycetales bacterium 4484_123]|nr:MAG: hypothetical protein B1H04_04290 [Planctomycetales bacterium 4484_123]
MQILVVAGFIVVKVLMPAGISVPTWALVAGVVCYMAVAYGLTCATREVGLRRLMGHPAAGRPGKLPVLMAAGTQAYLVVGLAALMLAGWGGLVRAVPQVGSAPLVGELVALGPFVAGLLLHWWGIYPLEQALRLRFVQEMAMRGESIPRGWSRRGYVGFQVRHSLLFVLVPVGAVVFIHDVLALLQQAGVLGQPAAWAAGAVLGGGVFLLIPAVIVRIWRTRPLPAGLLRDRLEACCRRAGLAYRDIVLWETGGVVANAAVMGLVGPVRYILLSDVLLSHLPLEGVEAVFAHEAGHVAHRHIAYMVVFTVGLLSLCSAGVEAAAGWLGLPAEHLAVQIPALAAVAGLWTWLFGLLSRQFERQADVFAAAACTAEAGRPGTLTARGVEVFGEALLTIGRLNGISPTKRNFRHGSIQSRLDYLTRLAARGMGPAEVDRQVQAIKLALWALLAAGLAALAAVAATGGQGG